MSFAVVRVREPAVCHHLIHPYLTASFLSAKFGSSMVRSRDGRIVEEVGSFFLWVEFGSSDLAAVSRPHGCVKS